MKRDTKKKPVKKIDHELWALIESKILNNCYLILPHAKIRQADRNITDIDVLDILENKPNRKRKRNKKKDTYSEPYSDWKYCVEGLDLNGEYIIRIIITFDDHINLLVVTVIRLEKVRKRL